jgi:hypothetical protein
MEEHGYSLSELENMLPWEKDIFYSLLINKIQEETDMRMNNG